ncbi:hypothetical protein [Phenylobacterium immobile]|nr:hypothetical protein [Phenylobacterium immobile]
MPSVVLQVLLIYGASRLLGMLLQLLDRAEDRSIERILRRTNLTK